eukprot:scaffold50342_cov63-Phaeocystis_antarctica.AAC.3
MRDKCPDVWAANNLANLGECEAKLGALPSAEGENFYADGNSPAHLSRPTTAPTPRAIPLEDYRPARCARAGNRAARFMRSSPWTTPTTARTSPSSPWPTPRARLSARSRSSCPSRPSFPTTSWPSLQPLSPRSASNRTRWAGACPPAGRRQTARRPATWRSTPCAIPPTTTRTTQRVSSRHPPSAASSLARSLRLACACPRDGPVVASQGGYRVASRRCPGGGRPHSAARQAQG